MARTRTLDELLTAYPRDVQLLARSARAYLLGLIPGAAQTIDRSAPLVFYGYGPGYKGMVAGMSISKTGVKLLIPGGASLPDPKGLLEGDGKVHRHIVLKTTDDLRKPGVKTLVRARVRAWRATL